MYPGVIPQYLKYCLFSKQLKGYGIHSPYIFDLVSRVLRNKIDPHVVLKAEELRRKMLTDKRTINKLDFGAGQGGKRRSLSKVPDLARHSAVPGKYGKLLARLAGEFGGNGILELGTSLGISTTYMALSRPDAPVRTIEACPETAKIAIQNFSVAGASNVSLVIAQFKNALADMKQTGFSPGFVFIDGDHRKEALLENFGEICSLTNDSVLIAIDDIRYSAGMYEAWTSIKNDRMVSVTLDFFRLGLVLLRKNIAKHHYIIRY
jgi:predicted O-methyltransferase YrrM